MTTLQAMANMKEFDPSAERHWPLILVKAVDPGCTLEIQIENCVTGEVTRVTTTENAAADESNIARAITSAYLAAYAGFHKDQIE
jgi:hypothetical protein